MALKRQQDEFSSKTHKSRIKISNDEVNHEDVNYRIAEDDCEDHLNLQNNSNNYEISEESEDYSLSESKTELTPGLKGKSNFSVGKSSVAQTIAMSQIDVEFSRKGTVKN